MGYEENNGNEYRTDNNDSNTSFGTNEQASENRGFYAYKGSEIKKPSEDYPINDEYSNTAGTQTVENRTYNFGGENNQSTVNRTYAGSGENHQTVENRTYNTDGENNQSTINRTCTAGRENSQSAVNRTYSSGNEANKKHGSSHKKKKGNKWLSTIAFAVIFGIVAALVFQGTNYGINSLKKDSDQISTTIPETEETNLTEAPATVSTSTESTDSNSVSDIVEQCMPSIVSVTKLTVQQVRDWFGGVQEYESEAFASGIIVGQNDTELLIATNNHVVDSATELTVTFVDETSASAVVKGSDSTHDVAVMAVKLEDLEESTKQAISIAVLGDSDAVRVGDDAIVIGNALGYGQSVTKGIVSALNREFTYEEYGIDCEMIQTDAAINPGNSGGAMLNSNGEVIGISDSKSVGTEIESVCYAIPISDVKELLTDFMNRETREQVDEDERGILGIRGNVVDSDTAQLYGMPQGVYVSETVDGMGAEKAGIIKGDIIVKANGQQISSLEDLSEVLSYFKVGENITITIERLSKDGEYESMELEVEVSEYND